MLTVGQVAAQLGLRVSAVHFYERRGLLPPVPRHHRQRRYDQRHLRRLALIGICQQAGLSLEQIQLLLTADPARWRAMVRDQISQVDQDMDRLARARQTLAGSLRCPADHPADECPHVHSMIDQYLVHRA